MRNTRSKRNRRIVSHGNAQSVRGGKAPPRRGRSVLVKLVCFYNTASRKVGNYS